MNLADAAMGNENSTQGGASNPQKQKETAQKPAEAAATPAAGEPQLKLLNSLTHAKVSFPCAAIL